MSRFDRRQLFSGSTVRCSLVLVVSLVQGAITTARASAERLRPRQGADATRNGSGSEGEDADPCDAQTEQRMLGAYGRFSGRIVHQSSTGLGQGAPEVGLALVLDEPLQAVDEDGQMLPRGCFSELVVGGRRDLTAGERLDLNGRLDRRFVDPARGELLLSGISVADVHPSSPVARALEPTYDGSVFTSRRGQVLSVLTYREPLLLDAPAVIMVLDRARHLAFVGTLGGFLPVEVNPFHGFHHTARIEAPSEADRAAVRVQGHAVLSSESLEALVRIGQTGPSNPHPDALYETWYFDPSRQTAYGFLSGGLAGWNHFLVRAIHLP